MERSRDCDFLLAEYLNEITDSEILLTTPKKKRSKRRQKDEMNYLKQRVEELQQKLMTLKDEDRIKRACSSKWENEAREQALKRQKAEQENTLLKKSLEEHVELAQELQYALSRRPSLSLFPFV